MQTVCPNALNTEALERIGALYKIEETIRGQPPDERRAYRQEHVRALLDQLHVWLTTTLETRSRKCDTSRAILYALNRWQALTRYCNDGRLEIDNLPVERALRKRLGRPSAIQDGTRAALNIRQTGLQESTGRPCYPGLVARVGDD